MSFVTRGMLDEPAHLATALIILGAVVRFRRSPPAPRFIATMLICSVAIDMDHLPAEFGSNALTNGTPRPYTHALWVVIAATLGWAVARFFVMRSGRSRPATVELVLAGAAWGVAAHFVRDIATAPMSFWLPVTEAPVQVPYRWYVAALLVIIALPPWRVAAPPVALGAQGAIGVERPLQPPSLNCTHRPRRVAGLNVLTWLNAYLDECGRTAGNHSPARHWNGSCPGAPAPRTSAPGHSPRPPHKTRTNNTAGGRRGYRNRHADRRHVHSQDFRMMLYP